MPSRSRVLVVDDDPALRETLGEVLSDDGFDVPLAENGHEALHRLDGWQADVVILDLMMPIMDAYAFRAALVENRSPMPPVILLSAAPGLDTAAAEFRAGGVIPKPFRLSELLEKVR